LAFSGIYWSTIENIRLNLSFIDYIILKNMIAGSLGGLVAALATNPLDVVKTRI
jgi:hypothetical protein